MAYATVYFDEKQWERALRDCPKQIAPYLMDAVTHTGNFEFQFDSVVYSVPLGKRAVFPTEIANHARRRGLIWENHLSSIPIELIRVETAAPLGTVDPHQCPVPGCPAPPFNDYSKMGLHLAEAHGTPAAGAQPSSVVMRGKPGLTTSPNRFGKAKELASADAAGDRTDAA